MTRGFHKAYAIFQETARAVPAYKDFLGRHGVRPKGGVSPEDFKSLPYTDKENYIKTYPLTQRIPAGQFPPAIHASSGSSGRPTYWFRNDSQELRSGAIHARIFREIYGIRDTEPTLVIICFSMGVWIAGVFTMLACREVSRRGLNISTVTPGIEHDAIMRTIRDLAPLYKNVILVGYPPFIADTLNEARRRRLFLPERTFVLTAGDTFSEEWRTKIATALRSTTKENRVLSLYGSADAGILGFETPLSILLRREIQSNRELRVSLCGENSAELPALFQYDPRDVFLESDGGEILITAETATPLVRYNIHDRGGTLPYREARKLLRHHNLISLDKKLGLDDRKLDFVFVRGRNDVAVTYYALNIPPEHLALPLKKRSLKTLLTGNFRAHTKTAAGSGKQQLFIEYEVRKKVALSERKSRLVGEVLADALRKANIEFEKLYTTLGDAARPRVKLCRYGHLTSTTEGNSVLLQTRGKKARIIKKDDASN